MVIDNLTSASFETSYYTSNNIPMDEEFEVASLFTRVSVMVLVEFSCFNSKKFIFFSSSILLSLQYQACHALQGLYWQSKLPRITHASVTPEILSLLTAEIST